MRMRAIDGDALRDRLQNLADDEWNRSTTTSWAEAYKECADIVEDAPTIEPEQLPFIVEPEPCRIPFSTMQRVCKHRRTGGIVYGGDAKPRDACHYEMYRSLWDECSMRNCPILNRREVE